MNRAYFVDDTHAITGKLTTKRLTPDLKKPEDTISSELKLHTYGIQGGDFVKNKSPLRIRFTWAFIAYTGIILALWFSYHNITWQAADRNARENAAPGTPLTVFTAIPKEALFPENGLFYLLALVMPGLLLIMILILLDRTEQYHAELMSDRQKLFDAEILRQNMRISLLGSQIDAHLVVNTLKGIKQLANSGENDKAALISDDLAAILRHRHTGDALVNIFVDFEILEKYILIINMQFDERFSVDYNVMDNLEACLIPGMVLQPVVENALVHGLQSKDQDARLMVKGFIKEDRVQFEISDNGMGIPPEKLKTIQDSLVQPEVSDFPDPGLHGVALTNIQRRIHLRYGGSYGITVNSVWGEGTVVKIQLPLMTDH